MISDCSSLAKKRKTRRVTPVPSKGLFWNVQRFFGIDGGPIARSLGITRDKGWTAEAYAAKLRGVCAVLRRIAAGDRPLAFVGLCEVETRQIVDDLIETLGWSHMVNVDRFASDTGIEGNDVAFMYSSRLFEPEPVRVESMSIDNRFASRDLLSVRLRLRSTGDEVQFFVVHWPSRLIREGDHLRLAHAYYLRNLVSQTLLVRRADLVSARGRIHMPPAQQLHQRWATPVYAMGDFNDEPFDASLREALRSSLDPSYVLRRVELTAKATRDPEVYLSRAPLLYNPCWSMVTSLDHPGTYYLRGSWRVYDQVLVSHGALAEGSPLKLRLGSVGAFREHEIECSPGPAVELLKRSGTPRPFELDDRTGVSDHLPLVFDVDVAGL